MLIPLPSILDPRLNDFRNVKEKHLESRGLFLAEGAEVVRRLLLSDVRAASILMSDRRVKEFEGHLPEDVPTYVLPAEEISKLLGFDFHSGVMACGLIPASWPLEQVVPRVGRARVVVLPEIGTAENLGSLIRLSAGLGADCLVVGERCTSPWMRRTVRVSMGSVFALPIVRSVNVMRDMQRLREEMGVVTVGAVLGHGAETLGTSKAPERAAVLFGSEAQGLRDEEIAACDRKVTIPMSLGVDSLNVSVSAAVVLWEMFREA